MPRNNPPTLWDLVQKTGLPAEFSLSDSKNAVALSALEGGTSLGVELEQVRGLTVVIYVERQLSAALSAVELDGVARRIVLCTPDLTPELLSWVATVAECDAVATDGDVPAPLSGRLAVHRMAPGLQPTSAPPDRHGDRRLAQPRLGAHPGPDRRQARPARRPHRSGA